MGDTWASQLLNLNAHQALDNVSVSHGLLKQNLSEYQSMAGKLEKQSMEKLLMLY